MRVLGLDPGKLSGCVDFRSPVDIRWFELPQQDTMLWLWEEARRGDVHAIVCETWKPRGGARTFQPFSLELIGWARGLSWLYDVPLVMQDPAIKVKLHDRAVKEFPEVGRGGGGHARDAMAHVLFYLQTQKHSWELP